jgi:hypothetical protein
VRGDEIVITQEQVWDVERTIKASAVIVAAATLLAQSRQDTNTPISQDEAIEQAQDLWKLAIS